MFENQAGSGFEDVSSASGPDFSVPQAHRGLITADLDMDGRLDAVTTVLGGKPEYWRNVTSGGTHWLELSLVGSPSNRNGIGAKVHVITKSGEQWNDMSSGVGYASSCSCPVHFGLGEDQIAEEVEILWPSGKRQILRSVKADAHITVSESQP